MAYTPVNDHVSQHHPSSSNFQPPEHISWDQQDQHTVSPETQFLPTFGGQKPFSEVNLQDLNPYWSYPDGSHFVPSHQRGWSGSTISTDKLNEKGASTTSGTYSLKKNTKKPSSSSSNVVGPWTWEIVTISIAFGAVGSIMGVLARFNGRALPEWPYYITLNALIALLATVTTATMSISLGNGISQLKWIRFKESRAPLTDMEVFDEASRGTWGALRLLTSARGGFLGSFGAVITIVALALGPFAQQVVTYQTRTVESHKGASVNRAMNYTGALPGNSSSTGFVPILPLKSAVYNGLFAENGRPGAALAFECQSGNCTWDPYETLGVCSDCHSLTSYIREYCAPDAKEDDCGWQVPQGAKLADSLDVFSMTSYIPSAKGDMSHATILKLIFMGTEAQDGLAGETKPWAQECTLSACLQTLQTRVENGVLKENVTRFELNNTVVDIRDTGDDDTTTTTTTANKKDNNVYFTSADNTTAQPYVMGIEAMLSMRGWFSTLFANGSAVRSAAAFNRTVTDGTAAAAAAVVVNLTVGISSGETFFDSDVVTAFYWNYYEYAGGIAMLMSDVATSMTVAFRGFAPGGGGGGGAVPVPGRALGRESYVHVRWGFAVLPLVVVAAAALFLALAVRSARRAGTGTGTGTGTGAAAAPAPPPWKGSALALLFHGLDEDARARFGAAGSSLEEKKRLAKSVVVQLDESDGSGGLLRA